MKLIFFVILWSKNEELKSVNVPALQGVIKQHVNTLEHNLLLLIPSQYIILL